MKKTKLFEDALKALGLPKKTPLGTPPKQLLGTPKKARSPSAKKMFRDARKTLDEKRGSGPLKPMKEWDETWSEYKTRCRMARREALLRRHVPSKTCVLCDEVKMRSRQWVILTATQVELIERLTGKRLVMVCKSCKMRLVKGAK